MCESPLVFAQQAAPLQTQPHMPRRSSGFASCRASLERSAECFEATVEARLHGGKGNAEDSGQFVNLQFFLEKIFGAVLVSRDIEKITEQAVLILFNQAVEQVGIAALETAGDGLGFIAHQCGEKQSLPWKGRGPEEAG